MRNLDEPPISDALRAEAADLLPESETAEFYDRLWTPSWSATWCWTPSPSASAAIWPKRSGKRTSI